MCRLCIDKTKMSVTDFDHYFAHDLEKLKPFVEDDLVVVTPKEIRVTERGKLTLRNIAMCFDAHLERVRQDAKTPVFSRTV
jgi:oxygen-independent coproporphyrinogen-3 oxidase